MAKRRCAACAEEIQWEASKCRHCGMALAPMKRPTGTLTIVVAVLSGFFGFAWIVGMVNKENHLPDPGPSVATEGAVPTPEMAVTAKELVEAYEKNEVAADNVYKGKRLQVSGTIRRIAKDISDDPYITMGETFHAVNCYFDSKYAPVIAGLSKGAYVMVEGKCRGLTLGSVMLGDCWIAK